MADKWGKLAFQIGLKWRELVYFMILGCDVFLILAYDHCVFDKNVGVKTLPAAENLPVV